MTAENYQWLERAALQVEQKHKISSPDGIAAFHVYLRYLFTSEHGDTINAEQIQLASIENKPFDPLALTMKPANLYTYVLLNSDHIPNYWEWTNEEQYLHNGILYYLYKTEAFDDGMGGSLYEKTYKQAQFTDFVIGTETTTKTKVSASVGSWIDAMKAINEIKMSSL